VLPLTVPEVRRLLLALAEPPERFGVRLAWSAFRRHHQAVAKRCHAARRARQLSGCDGGPPIPVLPAGALELTEERWQRVGALLPPQRPPTGRPNHDHRTMLAGMLWVMQTGAAWRDLPEQFGPWQTVHSRYRRWRKTGIWQRILDALEQETKADDSQLSL
jgi:transposase